MSQLLEKRQPEQLSFSANEDIQSVANKGYINAGDCKTVPVT